MAGVKLGPTNLRLLQSRTTATSACICCTPRKITAFAKECTSKIPPFQTRGPHHPPPPPPHPRLPLTNTPPHSTYFPPPASPQPPPPSGAPPHPCSPPSPRTPPPPRAAAVNHQSFLLPIYSALSLTHTHTHTLTCPATHADLSPRFHSEAQPLNHGGQVGLVPHHQLSCSDEPTLG